MRILIALESEQSIEKIVAEAGDDFVEWVDKTTLESIRVDNSFGGYDYAIVSSKLEELDEIIEFLDEQEIRFRLFDGSYAAIISALKVQIERYRLDNEMALQELERQRNRPETIVQEKIVEKIVQVPVEKIVERVVEVPVEVERIVEIKTNEIQRVVVSNPVTAFLSLSRQAGATTLARELANILSIQGIRTTILESPFQDDPYWDGVLRMKELIDDKEISFIEDFLRRPEERFSTDDFYELYGVHIAAVRKGIDWDAELNRDLLYAVSGASQATILDLGYSDLDEIEGWLDYATLYVVVDADLSRLANESVRVARIKDWSKRFNVKLVLNKATEYSLDEHLELELGDFFGKVPMIDLKYFHVLNKSNKHYLTDISKGVTENLEFLTGDFGLEKLKKKGFFRFFS